MTYINSKSAFRCQISRYSANAQPISAQREHTQRARTPGTTPRFATEGGSDEDFTRSGHAARADVLLPVRRRAGLAHGEDRRRRRDRGRAQFLRGRRASGRRPGLRQGLWAGPEDLQSQSGIDADEAHQPEEGARRGSGVRADRLGRGARPRRREVERGARGRADRRIGLSPARGEPGRRGDTAVVHGNLSGVPRRMGPGRHGLRLGAGRQVLPLRAPLRRVLAPRVHRVARHAAVRLPDLVRRERRGIRRRHRRLAARACARARHEARAGRAAPVGHRRVLGRVGADQAQDRRRVPLRAGARAAARDSARAPRPAVPQRPDRLALPRRTGRLLPSRSRDREAAAVG